MIFMVHRWIAVLISLVAFAAGIDFATAQGFGLGWTGSQVSSPTIPIVVAGTALPQSEDAVHPSMSRWSPSCLDSTWGVGCNASTQTCIAPTVGTPVETCQPPLQINVTGGTGNGTTATIDYYSASSYTFPVGQPINITNSAHWNTPSAAVVSYLQSTSGNCVTSGDTCITLGLAPTTGTGPVSAGSVPFVPGVPVYVQGTTGQLLEYDGGTNWGFGWGQLVSGGTYNNTTGVLSLTLTNPYFGASPTVGTLFNLDGPIFSGGTCNSPCGIGGWLPLASSSSGGDTLVFNLSSGLATANLTISAGATSPASGVIVSSLGESGPNGKWTPDGTWSGSISSMNIDVNAIYPYGFQSPWGCHSDLTCLASSNNTTNYWNYNGLIYQPWVVSASSCSNTSCSVSFANPTACASSCVTPGLNGTQIVAGQFSPPIMAWNTGPVAPYAVENGTLVKCVAVFGSANNPVQSVKIAVDGGAFVSAKYMLDPWGVGQASNPHDPDQASVTNSTYVYCVQMAANTVADGLHEWRAIACATAGPCGQLTSAITADATSGSPTLLSNSHYQNDTNHLAVTNSVDPNFQIYNGAYESLGGITASGAVYNSGSPPSVTFTYAPGTTILPIKVGMPVNVAGFVTNYSCSITSASGTGNTITYNYSGSCDFPVGTLVNISGMATGATQTENISSVAYNATNGQLAVTLASALWGTNPGYNNITQWNISGTTGTGSADVNQTEAVQIGNSGSGTVLTFQLAAGLSISINNNTGTISNPNTYSGDGIQVPVTATDGATYIQATGMSLSSFGSGGTIAANWNQYCYPTAVTNTTITCPLPANSPSASVTTEGTISSNGNIMCVVGGEADGYAPFNPALQLKILLDPNHFQVLNWMWEPSGAPTPGTNCSDVGANQTGCASATCGVTASMNSTIWFYRKDAGTLEMKNNASGVGAMGQVNDGSLWTYVNSGGTIQEQAAYVDEWNPSAISTGPFTGECNGSPFSALNWNATRPTYNGSYCVQPAMARASLYWGTTLNVSATVSNSGGCSTFESSTYNSASVVKGVPIIFLGLDPGTNGDGSNALFVNTALYWVHSNASGTLTLAATPNGACINETATMSGVKLQQDLSFKDIFFKCNTSLGCSASNPETAMIYANGGAYNSTPQYAKAGWFNYAPDTGNGTTQHEVTLLAMPTLNSDYALSTGFQQGGRARVSIDRSWTDLTLTPAVTLGPTLPDTIVSGGSLSGTCPGAACTETLTFTAGANQYSGAKFQAPDATGGPGQTITANSITDSGSDTTWNCSGCVVTASSTTSVSFVNPSATGTYVSGGEIFPLSIAIEVAAGTIGNVSSSDACASASYIPMTPPNGAKACVAGTTANSWTGTTNLYPIVTGSSGSATQVSTSNCLLSNNGPPDGTVAPFVTSVTPSSGSGINDVIILGSNSTAAPVYAFNQCASVQLYTVGPFTGNGAVDGWDSEATVTGAGFWEAGNSVPGNILPSPPGQTYITDLSSYNADAATDYSSYNWGDSSIWNLGVCHVQAAVAFHLRCAGSWKQAPESIGAVNFTTPPTVIHTYSSYANYLSNTPILCGGVDCITSSSLVFKLSDEGGGIIPAPMTIGFSAIILCNYYPGGWPQTSSVTTVQPSTSYVTWYDSTNNVVMLNAPASGTCNPITTSGMYFDNSYHTDLDFYRSGANDIPTIPHEFANRSPYASLNDFIIEQQDTRLSGDLEGLFTEGGNDNNVAVVNSYIAGTSGPGGFSGSSGIDPNSYGSINWLNLNDFAGSSVIPISYDANTNPSYIARAPQSDIYYINLNSGPSMYGFPLNIQPDNTYNMRQSSAATWSFRVESTGIVGSPLNPGGWWPSPTWGVNATGVPVTSSGQPGYNNLLALPWYGPSTDTGNSLN